MAQVSLLTLGNYLTSCSLTKMLLRFSHPRLAACVIPAGQFAGYCIAPPLMTVSPQTPPSNLSQVMAKRCQYLVSALLMALASGSLSVTFHFRTGPAESLQSMNSTDLAKGMPSLDLVVGYLHESKFIIRELMPRRRSCPLLDCRPLFFSPASSSPSATGQVLEKTSTGTFIQQKLSRNGGCDLCYARQVPSPPKGLLGLRLLSRVRPKYNYRVLT